MKNFLLPIALLWIILSCDSSTKTDNAVIINDDTVDLSFIKNNKIDYEIALVACDSCIPISDIGYRVLVNLNKEQKKTISQIKPETWIKLLKDTSSDWAANLILYDLYDESAIVLEDYDKKIWQSHLKKSFIIFWEEKFKAKNDTMETSNDSIIGHCKSHDNSTVYTTIYRNG